MVLRTRMEVQGEPSGSNSEAPIYPNAGRSGERTSGISDTSLGNLIYLVIISNMI